MTKAKAKRRRGRPPDRERVERAVRAARPDVALQAEKTAVAVFAKIAACVRADTPISIELLGVARLFTEWHTDFLSVQASGGVPETSDASSSTSPTPTKEPSTT